MRAFRPLFYYLPTKLGVLFIHYITMTTTKLVQPRLINDNETWEDYLEYLQDNFSVKGPVSTDFPDFTSYFQEAIRVETQEQAPARATQLKALASSLRKTEPDVVTINVSYYGGGDNGEIENVEYLNSTGQEVVLDLPRGFTDAIDELAWGLAYNTNPGFEISDGVNDGAYGTIEISLDETEWSITINHEANVVTTRESTHCY